MARILTGIQASGNVHLGNVLGAIKPAITLSEAKGNDSFFFIADMHSLTSLKTPTELQNNIKSVASAWLACGLDTNKACLFRQSRLSAYHTELMWYLCCVTPHPMAMNAVAMKDKIEKGLSHEANAGLYAYPILQSADILLYNANYVPVGKDQKQNLEIARDLAKTFNNTFGEVLVVPDALIDGNVMIIPGTDGRKMSKSLNNYINIFAEEKVLRRKIMSIQTDNRTIEEPKDFENCNVYKLFSLLASESEQTELQRKYKNGGMGYGYSKELLFNKILSHFTNEREKYNYYIKNDSELELILSNGEEQARDISSQTLKIVREIIWGI